MSDKDLEILFKICDKEVAKQALINASEKCNNIEDLDDLEHLISNEKNIPNLDLHED